MYSPFSDSAHAHTNKASMQLRLARFGQQIGTLTLTLTSTIADLNLTKLINALNLTHIILNSNLELN